MRINIISATDCNVLITNASSVGSVAVIRSLGRAGHNIFACDPSPDAIGFKSSYTDNFEVCPSEQSDSFIKWLRCYIDSNNIRFVIPSEGVLLALYNDFNEFSQYLPLVEDKDTTYRGMSKWDLFYRLINHENSKVSEHLPEHLLLKSGEDISAIESMDFPVFIKYDELYRKNSSNFSGVVEADNADGASEILNCSLHDYDRILVQEFVEGVGCGVFLLIFDGEVKAKFMHLRVHEVPYTGGASSLRKNWWNEEVYQDALAKVLAIGWQGVVMVEYRWKPETNDFYLMEMNCRFWGSLHLALFSGVDFPKLLIDCCDGRISNEVVCSKEKISCRFTFPKEVNYIKSILKSKDLTWLVKIKAVVEFFYLFLMVDVKSDFLFPRDNKLYFIRLYRFLKTLGR